MKLLLGMGRDSAIDDIRTKILSCAMVALGMCVATGVV
jgi:hypothetical protein